MKSKALLRRSVLGLIFVLFAAFLLPVHAADTVSFTDGAGRVLQVPREVRRIYATSPVANVLLYTLAPEKMVGWNYKLNPNEARFILPSVRNLPALGGWFGPSGTGNRETLLAAKPDIILSIGYNDATAVDFAERLQAQIGVPVIVASGRLQDFADTYELIGPLCGAPERAKELAAYCRRALADAKALADAIPQERRLRVYYAEGPRGLQTDTKGSLHAETLDLVGGENVAQGKQTENFGRAGISLEQVIAWQPDVLLICPEKADTAQAWSPEWLSAPAWRHVPAVANGRIFVIPGDPFNWFDRPPSVNRMLGLKWVAWVLYPDRVKIDMVAETRTFYRLFYHYSMGEDEARQILAATRPDFGHTNP
jgi:iron complex transport system substrate-binding protein